MLSPFVVTSYILIITLANLLSTNIFHFFNIFYFLCYNCKVKKGVDILNTNKYLDSSLNEIIGRTIRLEREKQGLSLEDLSKKMNGKIKRQNIAYYESARSRIKLSKFIMICDALGLNPAEIFDDINIKYLKNAKL